MSDLSPEMRTFHLEEWKSLREEVATAVRETRDAERYVLVGCFAIWMWILREHERAYVLALVLPVIAAVLGAWRVKALDEAIGYLGGYLRNLETRLGDPDSGWERYFRGVDGENRRAHEVGRSARAFWIITIIGSVVVSVAVGITVWNSSERAPSSSAVYVLH